jgi:hypothetical protein
LTASLLCRAELLDVDFYSLRHSSNSFLIEKGANVILIARRQAAATIDRVFGDLAIGRQVVVKKAASHPDASA